MAIRCPAYIHVQYQSRGGVSIREQRSRARSRRGGVSENWIAGSAAARLFFLTAIAIAIATRPFKFHEISVSYTSSSFVSSIHSLECTTCNSLLISLKLPAVYHFGKLQLDNRYFLELGHEVINYPVVQFACGIRKLRPTPIIFCHSTRRTYCTVN
jgi:hypothetical protein